MLNAGTLFLYQLWSIGRQIHLKFVKISTIYIHPNPVVFPVHLQE